MMEREINLKYIADIINLVQWFLIQYQTKESIMNRFQQTFFDFNDVLPISQNYWSQY